MDYSKHAVDIDDRHVVAASPARPRPHDLLRSLLPALSSFLARFIRNAGDAHDLAQEAAARALCVNEVPESKRHRPWLYQIVRNAAIDAHRRHIAVGDC